MKENFKGIGRKSIEVKGEAISGINIFARLIADSLNTNPNGIDLNAVRVKIMLNQAGESHEIVNSPLLPLVIDHEITNALGSTGLTISDAGIATGAQTVTASASLKGEMQCLFPIVFSGGIILKEGDSLKIELQVTSGAYDANCDADSYLVVETVEAEVEQNYVPFIDVHTIPTNQTRVVLSLGDNVQTATLIQVDKDNSSENSAAYDEVSFECNKFNYDRTYAELVLANRMPIVKYNGVLLARSNDLDDCSVAIDLNSVNVQDEMCFVVVRRYEFDQDVYKRQRARSIRHQGKFMRKHGLA